MNRDNPDGSDLTLVVETSDGVIVRRVRPAGALPAGSDPGPAAETATRGAAAVFGLPDFVFRPQVRSAGTRRRELGDAIVTVGDVGTVVQVKARADPSSVPLREVRWLDRNIKTAASQAKGTIRELNRGSNILVNERGRAIPIDGRTKSWVPVVVIDHPRPPDGYVPKVLTPTVVLLRRDWDFLFEQLRSTDAVVRYLLRVSSMSVVRLGDEPRRYYELANADAVAEPTPVDPRLAVPGAWVMSHPLLPLSPADEGEGRFHMLVRFMMEDIALARRPDGTDESDFLAVLAAVDTVPVGYRAELGQVLMTWLGGVTAARSQGVEWRFRRLMFPERPHLIFATASAWNTDIQNAFGMLVTLRHQELMETTEQSQDLLTVGILLTPRLKGDRAWDTSMAAVRGTLDLSPEYRRTLEDLWPVQPAERSFPRTA